MTAKEALEYWKESRDIFVTFLHTHPCNIIDDDKERLEAIGWAIRLLECEVANEIVVKSFKEDIYESGSEA